MVYCRLFICVFNGVSVVKMGDVKRLLLSMRPNNEYWEGFVMLEHCIMDYCKRFFLFIMFCTCSCRREICHGEAKFAGCDFIHR